MKSEKIINALGKIDDHLITEVFPGMPIRKKNHWPTVLAVAATVGLCLLCGWQLGVLHSPQGSIDPITNSEAAETSDVEEWMTESEAIGTDTVDWDTLVEKIQYNMRKGGASAEIQDAMLQYLQTECMDELPAWQNRLWWYAENDLYFPTALPSLYLYEYSSKDEEYRMDYLMYEDGQVRRSSPVRISLAEVKESILSAPAPKEIPESVKQEYVENLLKSYDPSMFTYLQWDCVFEITRTDQDVPQPYLLFTGQQGTEIVTFAHALYGREISRYASDASKLEEYMALLETLPGSDNLTEASKSAFAMYLVTHPKVETRFDEYDDVYIDTVLIDWIAYPRLNLRCLSPFCYAAYVFNGEQIVENTGSYSAEQYWTDFTDRFHQERYFEGVDQIGTEARNAAQKFFQENPEWLDEFIGGSWSWKIADVQGRRAAVLKCQAPILKNLGNSQIFWYFYDDGTFTVGPSGYWPGDWGVDLKLMAVLALQADEPDRLQRLRDVYALYNYENPETLQFVTSANEGDPAYAGEDETVYYRLISAELVNEEPQIYELQFEGIAIRSDDMDHSENYNMARYNYSWGLLYQDAAQEAVVQAMASEKSYKEQNLTVSQILTVDVQITAESNPFEPLAATRVSQ